MRFALLVTPALATVLLLQAWLLARPAMAQGYGVLLPQSPILSDAAAPTVSRNQPEPYEPYQTHPPGGARPLAPGDVAQSLFHRGFSDVSVVRQRGQIYLCEATGPRGERVRLVVDAASGDISGMQVIGYKGQ